LRAALGRTVRQLAPGVSVISYSEIGDHLDVNVVADIDIPALTTHQLPAVSGTQREEHHDQLARSL
jgi:hypothetical protein